MKTKLLVALTLLLAACNSAKDETQPDPQKSVAKKDSAGAGQPALAPLDKNVQVTPLSVSESRYAQLEKTDENMMRGGGGTVVDVRLKGDAVANATRVGNVKITKAEDDLGNSMVRERRSAFAERMDVIDRDNNFGPKRAKDETSVDVNLKGSLRTASRIASLEGTVTLSVSQIAKVEVTGKQLKNLIGKKIEHATLKKAGISVEVSKLGTSGSLITLKVADKNELLSATEVLDAGGERLNQGHSSGGFGGVMTTELFGDGKITDDAKLVLSVETDRQDLDVPFKFENLPLP